MEPIKKSFHLTGQGLQAGCLALMQALLIVGLVFLPLPAWADVQPAPPQFTYDVGGGQTYPCMDDLYGVISAGMQAESQITLHDANSGLNTRDANDPWRLLLFNAGALSIIGDAALNGGAQVYMAGMPATGNPTFGGLFRIGVPGSPNTTATHIFLQNLRIGDNITGYQVKGLQDTSNSGQGGLFYGNGAGFNVAGLDLRGANNVVFSKGLAESHTISSAPQSDTGQGGALYGSSLLYVGVDLSQSQNVTFQNNQASNDSVNFTQLENSAQGGAIYGHTVASKAVDLNNSNNLTFNGNNALAGLTNNGQMINSGQGGAIYARVGLNGIGVNLQGAQNVLFANNYVLSLGSNTSANALGGAIFSNGTINLEGVTFRNNSASVVNNDLSSGRGGAIFVQADGSGYANANTVNITPTPGKDVVFEGNYHNPGKSGQQYNSIYFGNTNLVAGQINSVALNVNVADGAMLDMRDGMASQPDNMASNVTATPNFGNVNLGVLKQGPGAWHLGGVSDMQSATTWQVNEGSLHLVRGSNGGPAQVNLGHAATASFSVASGASLLVTPDESAHRINARNITLASGSFAGLAGFSHGPENLAAGQRDMLVLAASNNLNNQSSVPQTSGTITIGSKDYSYTNLAWSADRSTLSGNLSPAGANPITGGGYVASTTTINTVYDPGRMLVASSVIDQFDRRAQALAALQNAQASGNTGQQPDTGVTTIRTNPDGSMTITFPDGRSKTTYPEDGSKTTTKPDDSTFEAASFEAATVTNPGGSITITLPDGSSKTTYPDGTVVTTYPDGTTATTPPTSGTPSSGESQGDTGVTTTRTYPDGSQAIITTYPDGTVVTTYPDGGTTTVKPGETDINWQGQGQTSNPAFPIGDTGGTDDVISVNGAPANIGGQPSTSQTGNVVQVEQGGIGTTTVTNPDGSTTITFPNGRRVTIHPDGSTTTTFSDGSSVTIYRDGSKTTTKPDGSSTTTYRDGTVVTSYPDGSSKTTNPDGTTTTTKTTTKTMTTNSDTINPDTTNSDTTNSDTTRTFTKATTITYPDGTSSTTYPGGTVVTTYPDGTVLTSYPDGSSKTTYPDGTTATTSPTSGTPSSGESQGDTGVTTTRTYPDGSQAIITTYPDGTVVTTYPDGGSTTVKPGETDINWQGQGQTSNPTLPTGNTDDVVSVNGAPANIGGQPATGQTGNVVQVEQGGIGTTTVTNPDGSTTTTSSSGTVVTQYPDGTITTTNPDGTFTSFQPSDENTPKRVQPIWDDSILQDSGENIPKIVQPTWDDPSRNTQFNFLAPEYRGMLFSMNTRPAAPAAPSWREQANYLQPPLMLAAGENSSMFDTQPLWYGNPAGDGGTMHYGASTSIWLSPSYGYTSGWTGSGYTVNTPALAAGLSHWFSDNFFMGFNISASWPESRSEFSENDARSIGFYITGGYVLPYEIELGFMAGFGHTRNDQTRHVYGESYNAEYDSQSLSIGLNVGKRFNATKNLSFRPFLDYQFLSNYTDDYTEPDGTYALGFDSHRDNLHLLRLGTGITWNDDGGAVITGRIFYNGLFGDDTPESSSFFIQNPSGTFTSIGDRMQEHSLGLSLSFDLPMAANFNLSFGYETLINERSINHIGNVGFMYKF